MINLVLVVTIDACKKKQEKKHTPSLLHTTCSNNHSCPQQQPVPSRIPSSQQIKLPNSFNTLTPKYDPLKVAHLQGKTLIIQAVSSYTVSYLDFDRSGFNLPNLNIFKLPPKELSASKKGGFSLYQPQPDAAFSKDIFYLQQRFQVIGFTFNWGLQVPSFASIVVAPIVSNENYQQVMPPKDYTLLYQHSGPSLAKVYKSCEPLLTGKDSSIFGPQMTKIATCQTLLTNQAGQFITNYDANSPNYQIKQSGSFSMMDYEEHRSLYLWQPVPVNDNYACLGSIATNTLKKPLSLLSSTQGTNSLQAISNNISSYYQNLSSIWKQHGAMVGALDLPAMVCIQKKYLVRGKLDTTRFVVDSSETVGLFRTTIDNSNKDSLNLELGIFTTVVAPKGKKIVDSLEILAKNTTVWMFNKNYVYVNKPKD